jgi:hypothetical protein
MPNKYGKIGWLIVLVILIGGGYMLAVKQKAIAPASPSASLGGPASTSGEPDASLYQAVILSNSQLYFGKLSRLNTDWPILTDVYYLRGRQQAPETVKPGAAPQPAFDLVKLGTEIHQPQDAMALNKSQIVYWENLSPDSQVIKVIGQLKTPTK